MSLATTGGGGGIGGGAGLGVAAMAHGGPNAMTTASHSRAPPTSGGPPPGTTAAPANVAALGADLLDKNQSLGLRNIRNVQSMPIVALDLYGDSGSVAYFPPVVDEDGAALKSTSPIQIKTVGNVTPAGASLILQKDKDASHKALRRLLSKSRGYEAVFAETISNAKAAADDASLVTIHKPHLLLGARQTKHLHPSTQALYTITPSSDTSDSSSSAAIAEDTQTESGISIQNGTLDGSTTPQNDDFDRVSLNLKLHSSKKALTILPEEAVNILFAKSKHMVHKSLPKRQKKNGKEEEEEGDETYMEYPPAIAVPAWACRDTTVESILEASSSSSTVLYQRSVTALAGSLIPTIAQQKMQHTKLFNSLVKRIQAQEKKEQLKMQRGESTHGEAYMPLVIMAGLTENGVELAAIQIGRLNPTFGSEDFHAPFGDFRVVSSVAYQHHDPLSIVKKAVVELSDVVDEVYPELEEDGGIAAIVTYGNITKQIKMKDAVEKALGSINSGKESGEVDAVWNDQVEFTSTREECVVSGTAVLAAVSHGRIAHVPPQNSDEKAQPAVVVKNVAPLAVGLTLNFHGGRKGTKWTNVKTIFDYDRRVPAGPYQVDFTAAECVAMKKDPSLWEDAERLVEEAKKCSGSGSKEIAAREEAAMELRVQVVQRLERGGEWLPVGNRFMVLTIEDSNDDAEEEKDRKKIAIETAVLELSLDPMGLLTNSLASDGKSIVQATKAARSSTFYYYLRIILAIAFFGGFFIKSFVEEKIFQRDTERVLAYYKHVAPGTINDGDERNARYLVWKYKGKKDKLWRRLETKYGVPVRQAHEWDDDDEEENVKEEDEEENLDDDDDDDESSHEGQDKGDDL